MAMIQVMLFLLFGVPLIVACLTFMLCAMWMQMREDQRCAQKQGAGESS